MKSRTARINEELAKEIERIAKKNEIKFVDASREIMRLLKQNKNKKLRREIQF